MAAETFHGIRAEHSAVYQGISACHPDVTLHPPPRGRATQPLGWRTPQSPVQANHNLWKNPLQGKTVNWRNNISTMMRPDRALRKIDSVQF
jgi:hypothetical protein